MDLTRPPRIVVFGAQQITSDCLKVLLGRDYEVPLVITYELELEPVYGYTLVSKVCEELGLPCRQPARISDELIDEIRALEPDLIVSTYYRKILPRRLLEIPRCGAINIHPSLLPRYRGRVPTAWAILNGEKTTGVTLHYIDGKIDTGDIIAQKNVPIPDDMTGFQLYQACMAAGAELFEEHIDRILDGTVPARAQTPGGSYFGALDGLNRVDWRESAARLVNKSRVFADPYGGLECRILNKIMIIWRASHVIDSTHVVQQAGRILEVAPTGELLVSCVDGIVQIDEYDLYPPLTELERPIYLRVGQQLE